MRAKSVWFSFSHVFDLEKASLVSFLEEIEPRNLFSPDQPLSVAELSLALV
jgi:hypothetical protein